jgi:hypothetical protein
MKRSTASAAGEGEAMTGAVTRTTAGWRRPWVRCAGEATMSGATGAGASRRAVGVEIGCTGGASTSSIASRIAAADPARIRRSRHTSCIRIEVTGSGASGFNSSAAGIGLLQICPMSAPRSGAVNSVRPVSRRYATSPSAHRSLDAVAGSPRSSSGAR